MSTDASTLFRPRARRVSLSIPRPKPELAALLVLAGVLYLWSLSTNGWVKSYAAASSPAALATGRFPSRWQIA